MKTTIPFLAVLGSTLLAGSLAFVRGGPPATPDAPASAPSGASREASPHDRVLLLETERTLIGEIEKQEDGYRVRRLFGETVVPTGQVLAVCDSLEGAYQFLRARANLGDADERLRLASWCRQHELRGRALEEVEAACQLRPGDAQSERLRRYLHNTKDQPTPKVVRKPEDNPFSHVDLTDEALGLFSSRVQPILLNTCAGCHTGERSGKFKLARVYDVTLTNRHSVQQNLTAVLAQVNGREPLVSPLLTKAVSVHAPGMLKAPLRTRDLPAYRTLEDWVRLTLAQNPQLSEKDPLPTPAAEEKKTARPAATLPVKPGLPLPPMPAPTQVPTPVPVPAPAPAPAPVLVPAPAAGRGEVTTRQVPIVEQPPAPAPAPPAPKAQTEPGVADPVDPDTFNRQFHPGRPRPSSIPEK